MIKPEDLRKGNYVNYYERPVFVESINSNGINIYATHDESLPSLYSSILKCEHEFKDLEGIPLTEELLVKAGFENKHNGSYFELNGIGLIIGYAVDGSFVTGNSFGSRHCHFWYLHQLQNLYFALTGTELTIKL